jgi:ribonuclease HI
MSKHYYAIVRGKKTGIYTSWTEAGPLVQNFSGALYKKFQTRGEAEQFIQKSTALSSNDVIHEESLFDKTVIYTDGSYENNEGGGYGIVILASDGNHYEAHGRVPSNIVPLECKQESSNNIAELYAINVALSLIEGNVILYSDSRYAIDSLTTYIHAWKKKVKNIPNGELIQETYNKIGQREVAFVYVPSHSGVKHNERADRLATLGRLDKITEIPFIMVNVKK